MRWIPGNQQRRLEPWMYTRGERRRVAITAGSQAANPTVRDKYCGFLRAMIANLGRLDVEVVVAAPEAVATVLTAELPGLRAGWIPLDVLAPTCDLVVSHGGGVTSMTATNAGVPQLFIPQLSHSVAPAQRWSAYGAAITLMRGEDSPDRCVAACEELLTEPSYTQRSAELAGEIASLPLPADVVDVLEKLVVG